MMSWVVVKQELLKESRTRKMWMDDRMIKKVEGVAKEVGWIDVIVDEWKRNMKKEMWRHIHRDIVSTVR